MRIVRVFNDHRVRASPNYADGVHRLYHTHWDHREPAVAKPFSQYMFMRACVCTWLENQNYLTLAYIQTVVTQLLAVAVCINKSSITRNYNPIRICSSGWLATKEAASGRGDCDQLMTVIPSEQLTNLWKHEFVSSALLVQTSHATPSCEETPLSYKVHVEERVHSGDEQLFARSKP